MASPEDYQNIFKDEKVKQHMKNAASIAKDFKPVPYGEIWTHSK